MTIEQHVTNAVAAIAKEISDKLIDNMKPMCSLSPEEELVIRGQILQQTMVQCAAKMGGKIDVHFA